MKFRDGAAVRGRMQLQVFDKDGRLKEERIVKNLTVNAGLAWIAGRMRAKANIPTDMGYIAVGTGNTTAAAAQTALVGTELARVAFDSAPTIVGAITTYITTFPAGTGTGAIVEAGVFNASSGGTMLCRTTFDVVNKAAGDSMTITWTQPMYART